MRHSFLFEPAVWSGTGTLWRADGEPLGAESRTEIAHRPDCWVLSGKLRVLGSPPTDFVQAYLIEPPRGARDTLRWTFESALFGAIQGRFAEIGDSILAVYGCEATGFHGAEHYRREAVDTYRATGMLLNRGQLVYSWEMVHRRAAG
ncbi:MAG: hypothetical protein JSS29_11585 [Proteobacteria bacterium]|nr:hypothetical protein [Pseudomonadota bacterium]